MSVKICFLGKVNRRSCGGEQGGKATTNLLWLNRISSSNHGRI